MEAITCNKLSHCLFDFDCPNFDQYQNEKYNHQTFKFHNLFSCSNELKMLSVNDLSFYRKDMNIEFEQNDSKSRPLPSNYKFKINLPFADENKFKKDQFIFRFLFKPESGQLWGFNQFFSDGDLFHQIDYNDVLKNKP